MTCKYETRWAEREKYCDNVEKVYIVRMCNHVQQMYSTGCTDDAIKEYIVKRTEAVLLIREQYCEILTNTIRQLKAMSLDYYLNVVMKIR